VADKQIPQPTPEQSLALSRAGVGNWNLVWNSAQNKWTIKKIKDITSQEITYEDWKSGQKIDSSTSFSVGRGDVQGLREYADPLLKYVRDNGLRVVTDPKTNKTSLEGFIIDKETGKRNEAPVEHFLYLDKNGAIQLSYDYDEVKSSVIKDLKSTGQLDTLFKQLYDSKKISKQTYDTKNLADASFNAALVDSIRNYSASVVVNREYNDVKQAPNFMSWLSGSLAGGGGAAVAYDRTYQDISKLELNAFIDQIYLETVGRKPTDDQRKSKLKELNKIVQQGILQTTTQVGNTTIRRTSGGFQQQEQALALQEQLKEENPLEYERRQAFGFMGELQKILSGGQ